MLFVKIEINMKKRGIAYNNIVDTIDKKTLKKILDLRMKKHLSYKKIAKEMNMSPNVIFKLIKKHLGLQTHHNFPSFKVI